MRLSAFFAILLLLAVAPLGFGGVVSGCVNLATSPYTGGSGSLHTQFTCSLYNDYTSYTIGLTTYETQGGASLADNAVGAGYFIVINGDPSSLPDNSNPGGLLDQSLWQTVLYFAIDPSIGPSSSDALTVDWAGAFPPTSTILALDDSIYPGNPDSAFFVESGGAETVIAPDGDHTYDIYSIPEPGTIALLGFGLALLGGAVLKRRRTAGRAA